MKALFFPILSLVVCSVLFFQNTECVSSTVVLPSPTAVPPNSTTHNIKYSSVTSTVSPNASTVHVTSTLNKTSVFTTLLSNKTSTMSVHPNTSIIVSTSHPHNSSIHNSSMYTTLASVIMSSSAGNSSIHNSTIHPTPLPTHSINVSSTVVQNASSSHVIPTMTVSPSPATSVFPSSTMPPTTPTPSTMPPTTPTPLPEGKYSVSKNGAKCLLLWLGLKFTITYKNNTGNKLQTKAIVMPTSGKASGTCEESLSSVRISWTNYSFEAYFHTVKGFNGRWDAASPHWTTINVTITAHTQNNPDFVNANDTVIRQSVTNEGQLEWLSGRLGKSLNCSKAKELKTGSMVATVENLRIQPFEVPHGGDFAEADTCSPGPTPAPTQTPTKKSKTDTCSPGPTPAPTQTPTKKSKSSNTVAIAVGCSLAGLVLIVLIGYFIGRRRKRASTGYRKL